MMEKAWRVFSGEFNDTTLKINDGADINRSHVVTPLGAQINRLFIVGVLTEVENMSSGGELLRAHVSDPTGVYFLYPGKYQPEISEFLEKSDIPSYVAIAGKSRTYEPEEGTLYVSVRPEIIKNVDETLRDYWILETCKHTKKRIEATLEASEMKTPSAGELQNLGYEKEIAEGVIKAVSHYGPINVNHYQALIKEALTSLKSGDIKVDSKVNEIEKTILAIIGELEGEQGVPWDNLVERGKKEKFDKESIEESLESLMEKGLIYEPVLGRLKVT